MGAGEDPVREPTAAAAPLESAAGQELVRELRRVKRASGLSFARLEANTPYSRASLERYVNGKLFPPRQAVEAIAKACRAAPEVLLRLWDDAATAGPAPPARPTAAPAPAPPAPAVPVDDTILVEPPMPAGNRPSRRRRGLVAVLGTAVVLGLTLLGINVAASDHGQRSAQPSDGCRDYFVDMHAYTVGRMCWTAKDATVTGYLTNQAEPARATAQLCVSNHPNTCAQIIELASASTGQTSRYEKTVGLPPGYGAWIRTCLDGFCTAWK